MLINVIVNGHLLEKKYDKPVTVKEVVYTVDAVLDSQKLDSDNPDIWIRGAVPYLNGEVVGGDVEMKEGEILVLAPAEVLEEVEEDY
jgi:hypothetical protein